MSRPYDGQHDLQADALLLSARTSFIQADQAYFQMTNGLHLQINPGNGVRSVQAQAQRYIDGNILGIAAHAFKPGESIHNYGLALDLIVSAHEAEIVAAMNQAGWQRPYQADERWHFEAVNSPDYQTVTQAIQQLRDSGLTRQWYQTVLQRMEVDRQLNNTRSDEQAIATLQAEVQAERRNYQTQKGDFDTRQAALPQLQQTYASDHTTYETNVNDYNAAVDAYIVDATNWNAQLAILKDRHESILNDYNAYVADYNNFDEARNQYNSDVTDYNDALTGYNAAVEEYNASDPKDPQVAAKLEATGEELDTEKKSLQQRGEELSAWVDRSQAWCDKINHDLDVLNNDIDVLLVQKVALESRQADLVTQNEVLDRAEQALDALRLKINTEPSLLQDEQALLTQWDAELTESENYINGLVLNQSTGMSQLQTQLDTLKQQETNDLNSIEAQVNAVRNSLMGPVPLSIRHPYDSIQNKISPATLMQPPKASINKFSVYPKAKVPSEPFTIVPYSNNNTPSINDLPSEIQAKWNDVVTTYTSYQYDSTPAQISFTKGMFRIRDHANQFKALHFENNSQEPLRLPGTSMHNFGASLDLVASGNAIIEPILKSSGWQVTREDDHQWHIVCVNSTTYQNAVNKIQQFLASDGLPYQWYINVAKFYFFKNQMNLLSNVLVATQALVQRFNTSQNHLDTLNADLIERRDRLTTLGDKITVNQQSIIDQTAILSPKQSQLISMATSFVALLPAYWQKKLSYEQMRNDYIRKLQNFMDKEATGEVMTSLRNIIERFKLFDLLNQTNSNVAARFKAALQELDKILPRLILISKTDIKWIRDDGYQLLQRLNNFIDIDNQIRLQRNKFNAQLASMENDQQQLEDLYFEGEKLITDQQVEPQLLPLLTDYLNSWQSLLTSYSQVTATFQGTANSRSEQLSEKMDTADSRSETTLGQIEKEVNVILNPIMPLGLKNPQRFVPKPVTVIPRQKVIEPTLATNNSTKTNHSMMGGRQQIRSFSTANYFFDRSNLLPKKQNISPQISAGFFGKRVPVPIAPGSGQVVQKAFTWAISMLKR